MPQRNNLLIINHLSNTIKTIKKNLIINVNNNIIQENKIKENNIYKDNHKAMNNNTKESKLINNINPDITTTIN